MAMALSYGSAASIERLYSWLWACLQLQYIKGGGDWGSGNWVPDSLGMPAEMTISERSIMVVDNHETF